MHCWGEAGAAIPSFHSDNYLFQLHFLFMFFKNSAATSCFQIMTLAMTISSPLCGISGAHPMINCAVILSAWKRRTKPQDDNQHHGIGCTDWAHSCHRNYIALYAQDMAQKPRKELQSQIPDWKTEIWSYTCGHTSGLDSLLSMAWTVHVGINTFLVNVYVLIFLKSVLKHWNDILVSTSLYMSLPWQVLLVF